MNEIPTIKIAKETVRIDIGKSGVGYTSQGTRYEEIENDFLIPDLIREISENCKLTRDTVCQILLKSNRLQDFLNNPQRYIEEVTKIINYVRANECIDGITYTKQEGKSYSFVDVFDLESNSEMFAYLDKNAVAVQHSLYDYVIYDNSSVEKDFAQEY